MSAQANYFRVGVFVIAAIALTVAAVIIFGNIDLLPGKMIMYETYVSDSVQGMSLGTKVRMNGVPLGAVEEIGFADLHYDIPEDRRFELGRLIMIRFEIDPKNLRDVQGGRAERLARHKEVVDAGLRARIASAGITGGRFLEVDFLEAKRFPPLEVPWEPKYLYLPSAPGQFAEIIDSIDELTEKLGAMDLEAISNDVRDMIHTIKEGVVDFDIKAMNVKLHDIMDDIHGRLASEDITVALENLRSTTENTKSLAATLDEEITGERVEELMGNVDGAVTDLRQALEDLPGTMTRVDRLLGRVDYLMATEGEDLEVTLQELRIAIENLRELTETAKQYPAYLIFGNEPAPSEPGGK